jgi:glycosyltransferase involved in cell wall biosynthesis
MNILQICSKPPFPPKDGGALAMNILTQGLLNAGHHVKVLTVNTSKHFVDLHTVDIAYKQKTNYEAVFIDTSIKPLKALLSLFSPRSYNIERFFSGEFEQTLIRILKEETFDIVHLETLYVSPYVDTIRKYSSAKIVLRSQNVEFQIWERLATNTKNPLKKWYLKILAKRLRNYELSYLNNYDGIAAITNTDLETFKNLGCQIPLIHIPFGTDLSLYTTNPEAAEFPSIFHIGAMDWRPNEEGIKWLVNEVWPMVHLQDPELKLHLAGRKMPDWLLNLDEKGIHIAGEVADAQQFILSKSIMLVPLFSGGGMRVKIIEGMALGKTIITTAIGAEGIDYTNEKDIIIANTKAEFVAAILKCTKYQDYSQALGKNARLLMETKYDNKLITKKLSDFYSERITK